METRKRILIVTRGLSVCVLTDLKFILLLWTGGDQEEDTRGLSVCQLEDLNFDLVAMD